MKYGQEFQMPGGRVFKPDQKMIVSNEHSEMF
ncbi:hypothetical protein PM8797T_32340 [Gimesia maris DSM 8797]|jgi:hypothetical protein|nr:hypothetical protein PM8797T_32340 [Gimesia maris DSM 8797]